MEQQRLRFRDYSEKRLHALRWCLFEHSEVRNVAHVEKDIISVSFVGKPRLREWLEHLSSHGYQLDPVADLAA